VISNPATHRSHTLQRTAISCDVTEGQSGGPLWRYDAAIKRHIIGGVISYGTCVNNATCKCCAASYVNYAVQLNKLRYDDVRAWAAVG
jgi:V8-like Glu-specific endopeptidase